MASDIHTLHVRNLFYWNKLDFSWGIVLLVQLHWLLLQNILTVFWLFILVIPKDITPRVFPVWWEKKINYHLHLHLLIQYYLYFPLPSFIFEFPYIFMTIILVWSFQCLIVFFIHLVESRGIPLTYLYKVFLISLVFKLVFPWDLFTFQNWIKYYKLFELSEMILDFIKLNLINVLKIIFWISFRFQKLLSLHELRVEIRLLAYNVFSLLRSNRIWPGKNLQLQEGKCPNEQPLTDDFWVIDER